jgi:hypothetical protein
MHSDLELDMEGNRIPCLVHCFVMIREKFKHGGTVFVRWLARLSLL